MCARLCFAFCNRAAIVYGLVVHYGLNVTECFMHRNCIRNVCCGIKKNTLSFVCLLHGEHKHVYIECARKRPLHGTKERIVQIEERILYPLHVRIVRRTDVLFRTMDVHAFERRRGIIIITAHCIHSLILFLSGKQMQWTNVKCCMASMPCNKQEPTTG